MKTEAERSRAMPSPTGTSSPAWGRGSDGKAVSVSTGAMEVVPGAGMPLHTGLCLAPVSIMRLVEQYHGEPFLDERGEPVTDLTRFPPSMRLPVPAAGIQGAVQLRMRDLPRLCVPGASLLVAVAKDCFLRGFFMGYEEESGFYLRVAWDPRSHGMPARPVPAPDGHGYMVYRDFSEATPVARLDPAGDHETFKPVATGDGRYEDVGMGLDALKDLRAGARLLLGEKQKDARRYLPVTFRELKAGPRPAIEVDAAWAPSYVAGKTGAVCPPSRGGLDWSARTSQPVRLPATPGDAGPLYGSDSSEGWYRWQVDVQDVVAVPDPLLSVAAFRVGAALVDTKGTPAA